MKIHRLSALFMVFAPCLALAQDSPAYRCTSGELERRVEVLYETGGTVPCEVHYFKDVEAPGDSEVLWRALNEEGYCEAKASEMVARLEGWGWVCSASGDTPAALDDTDTLIPSEDPEGGDDS